MADISKDTFHPSKRYQKVIWQKQRPIMDFDLNEMQDIAQYERGVMMKQLVEGIQLLGSAGWVYPHSNLPRTVSVQGGVAFDGARIIHIPTYEALQVFDSSTVSGVHSSVVYVEYWDEEVTYQDDPDIHDPAFGESGARLKRNVQVKVKIGASDLDYDEDIPFGHSAIELAVITHDFSNGAMILDGDIVSFPSGVTPGELSGYGPRRTLKMVSNAKATMPSFELDTRESRTSGALLYLSNHGTRKAAFDYRGYLSIGKAALPSEALDVSGNGVISGNLTVGGSLSISGTVDGVDVGSHNHTGGTNGPKLDHGAALTGLGDDDHTQYVHISTARTITARHTFNPSSVSSPFILGTNAQGQLVTGLNADQLDGYHGSAFPRKAEAATITGSWAFNGSITLGSGVTVGGVDLASVKDSGTGIDHGKLTGRGDDDHTQYVHNSIARTITARHTFNPSSAASPFVLGSNAQGQLVSGLNADQLDGKHYSDLKNEFVDASGDTMTGALTLKLSSGNAVILDGGSNPLSLAHKNGTTVKTLISLSQSGVTFAEAVTMNGSVTVGSALTVSGRAKFSANKLDTRGSPASASVTTNAFIQVNSVGARALIHFFKVDPGTYSGSYDVYIYASNSTSAELLAKWTSQTGVMEDRVPWFFDNARSDERMYVYIVKSSDTGTAHTFSVSVKAERFA